MGAPKCCQGHNARHPFPLATGVQPPVRQTKTQDMTSAGWAGVALGPEEQSHIRAPRFPTLAGVWTWPMARGSHGRIYGRGKMRWCYRDQFMSSWTPFLCLKQKLLMGLGGRGPIPRCVPSTLRCALGPGVCCIARCVLGLGVCPPPSGVCAASPDVYWS